MPKLKLTPKQMVRRAEPKTTLDYYESLRAMNLPCWFIRHGLQGEHYTEICATPRAAWKAALDSLEAACRKVAA